MAAVEHVPVGDGEGRRPQGVGGVGAEVEAVALGLLGEVVVGVADHRRRAEMPHHVVRHRHAVEQVVADMDRRRALHGVLVGGHGQVVGRHVVGEVVEARLVVDLDHGDALGGEAAVQVVVEAVDVVGMHQRAHQPLAVAAAEVVGGLEGRAQAVAPRQLAGGMRPVPVADQGLPHPDQAHAVLRLHRLDQRRQAAGELHRIGGEGQQLAILRLLPAVIDDQQRHSVARQ